MASKPGDQHFIITNSENCMEYLKFWRANTTSRFTATLPSNTKPATKNAHIPKGAKGSGEGMLAAALNGRKYAEGVLTTNTVCTKATPSGFTLNFSACGKARFGRKVKQVAGWLRFMAEASWICWNWPACVIWQVAAIGKIALLETWGVGNSVTTFSVGCNVLITVGSRFNGKPAGSAKTAFAKGAKSNELANTIM